MTDMVNHPKHYSLSLDPETAFVRGKLIEDGVDGINIECFEAMISMLTVDELRGYLRGNSFKYRWRYTHKSWIQDLEKAAWYERKLLALEVAVKDFNISQ